MIHAEWFFYVSLAILIVGSYLDFTSSKDFIYYGVFEKNPLWRDKWGYFKPGVHHIALGAFIALGFVLKFATAFENQTGILFLIPGVVRTVAYFLNEKQKKANREKQKAILTTVRALAMDGIDDPDSAEMRSLFNGQPITIKAGRAFYRLFGWLWAEVPESTPNNDRDAAYKARKRVVEWGQQVSPDKWFPR